jgi:hypothetical protein
MATLSSLVAARDVATMAEVEEAITRQVLHGGDFITSLLEIVDRTREPALTGVLADHLGLPSTFSPLPPASPELLRLMPGDLAKRHTIYPIAWTQRSLTVAVADLLPEEALGDLTFVLGRSIVQAAAPTVRIREALARDYGVPLDRRLLRLLARLDGLRDPSPSSLPPPRRRRTEDGPLPRFPGAPAMPASTSAFGGFRRETLAGFAPAHLPSTRREGTSLPPRPLVTASEAPPAPASADANANASSNAWSNATEPTRSASVSTAPAPDRAASAFPSAMPPRPTPAEVPVAKRSERPEPPAPTAAVAPPQPPVEIPLPSVTTTGTSPSASGSRAAVRPREVMSWARSAIVHGTSGRKRRRGPMSLAEAETGLTEASEATEALEVFFDFAQQYFAYSALFFIQGDVAGGRDAYGVGANQSKVNGIGIPLDLPSHFAEVRKSGAPYVGIASRSGLEAEIISDLERPPGIPYLLLPVVVRGRTVGLLFGDEDGAPVELSMAGDIVGLCALLARSLERIAVEKKQRRVSMSELAAAPKPPAPPSVAVPTPLVVPPQPDSAPSLSPPQLGGSAEGGAEAVVTARGRLPSDDFPAGPETVSGPASQTTSPSEAPPSTEPEPSGKASGRKNAPFLAVQELLAGRDATSTPLALGAAADWARPSPSPVAPLAAAAPRRNDTPRPQPLTHEQSELLRSLLAPDARVNEILPLVVRQGAAMVSALVAALPGPTDVPRASVMAGDARPSHTGPVFRALVALRRVALPHVIAQSGSPDTAYRFFSTFLLGELPFEGAPEAIAARLFDVDYDVQRIAVVAARLLGPTRPIAIPVLRRLEAVLRDEGEVLSRRRRAATVLGELHARVAVPSLLDALSAGEPVADSAHTALVAVTCQDFGMDQSAWSDWWEQQQNQHRVVWLIDALIHPSPDLRVRAAEELRTLAPRSGLSRVATASPEELAELHRRYLLWWRESGHAEAAALDE